MSAAVLLLLTTLLFAVSFGANNYDYWCTGNCNKPVNKTTHSGIILMGGGSHVDDAFKQQITWSNCGDFLVICANGTDSSNAYIYGLGCANSVATLSIKNKDGANEQFVVDKINAAEAIFFSGGHQSVYLRDWQDSKLQESVQSAISNRNVPIGGTSAGCDIQSYYIYSAMNGSAKSDEALENPYYKDMTFSNFFVTQKDNILYDSIIDTHLVTRDRFGRLFAFVGRLRTDDNPENIKGIGINENTAIAIDMTTQIGTILGPSNSSEAYIILPDHNPSVCKANTPLTYRNVTIQKLLSSAKDTFNFKTWNGGRSSQRYTVSAVNGTIHGDPYNP